uniref:Uncharacterized protein n=1 Tax=Arundo donax TaxID=35708 RepID=A0A0A9DU31_ARUDO
MSQNELPCRHHVCRGKTLDQCNSKHAPCCFIPGSASELLLLFVWCFKKVAEEHKLRLFQMIYMYIYCYLNRLPQMLGLVCHLVLHSSECHCIW